ncbi:MAG: Peptide deformylase [Chlamydiae bacterium]|nr:Peptide deformylase [Chlamydiota bacterium]
MAKWRLRYWGDPVLREHCQPIEEITDEIKELALFMIDYVDNNRGIGLAAPQVGVPIRLFILRDYILLPDGKWVTSEPKVFINPKIIWKSKETTIDSEGCLSFPNMTVGPIERPQEIHIEATDLDGNIFIDKREGMNARVTFHENDHLNGVLHIDRLSPRVRKKIEPQLHEIKENYSQ